ncbi:hypothetical protein CDL15_Pgr020631 [Punica granatum]|uniref:Uncharacterized protein n=1 Tax=Punica granatum TaxID=22663 RepID=A0A218XMZ8_PUNGR|nr:hypothetical protein CDL15_Pgr020631 [Punica granatum]
MRRRLCTVGRPSDRDHLFTREGEGYEEPFERDGTTRRSRGTKRHAWKARRTRLVALGTQLLLWLERDVGDLKWKI